MVFTQWSKACASKLLQYINFFSTDLRAWVMMVVNWWHSIWIRATTMGMRSWPVSQLSFIIWWMLRLWCYTVGYDNLLILLRQNFVISDMCSFILLVYIFVKKFCLAKQFDYCCLWSLNFSTCLHHPQTNIWCMTVINCRESYEVGTFCPCCQVLCTAYNQFGWCQIRFIHWEAEVQ